MPGMVLGRTVAGLELQLLSTSLPCDLSSEDDVTSGPPSEASSEIVGRVVAGDYLGALGHAAAKPILLPYDDDYPDSYGDYVGLVRAAARAFLEEGAGPGPGRKDRALSLMALGVASLYVFVQGNLAGPKVDAAPLCAADLHAEPGSGGAPVWEGEAQEALRVRANGEDTLGRCKLAQYLVLAQLFLVEPELPSGLDGPVLERGGCDLETLEGTCAEHVAGCLGTGAWWAARAVTLHQRLLAGRSSTLRAALLQLTARTLDTWAGAGGCNTSPGGIVTAVALVESALVEGLYGHVDSSMSLLERAGDALGVRVEVSGAMGMRTAHQVDAKAQLVVRMNRSAPMVADTPASEQGPGGRVGASEGGGEGVDPQAVDVTGERGEGVMMTPRLLSEEDRTMQGEVISSTEQLLLLGLCTHVKQSQAEDDLKGHEMAPYMEAVMLQEENHRVALHPLVRRTCSLFTARNERHRARTRERSFNMMGALVDALDGQATGAPPAARMRCAFAVSLPLMPTLKKEWGEMLVGYGLVGEALPMFEELELWDNLIACLRMMDRLPEAEALCRSRLEATPGDPKLLCVLGDLTKDDTLFLEAWESSGHKHARSQRSLARRAVDRKEFDKAAGHWELALKLNPLHMPGWFSLGYCCLQVEGREDRALQAYTRCVQQEPDNGEAWNNIAALNMRKGRPQEAFVALTEAVKYKGDSWRTWDNYAQVAVETEHYGTAVRAYHKVHALTDHRTTSEAGLVKLLERLEAKAAAGEGGSQLERQVGDLLREVSDKNTGLSAGRAWGLLGRFHRARGEGGREAAHECDLKRVRALQSSRWAKEEALFQEYAEASLQLCAGHEAAGGPRDLSAARLHLRGVIKMSEANFEDSEQHARLREVLERVTAKEAEL